MDFASSHAPSSPESGDTVLLARTSIPVLTSTWWAIPACCRNVVTSLYVVLPALVEAVVYWSGANESFLHQKEVSCGKASSYNN